MSLSKGTTVQIIDADGDGIAKWSDGSSSSHEVGQFGVITEEIDSDGDYEVKAGGDDWSKFIGSAYVTPVSTTPAIGTASLTVEVRFFVGDLDVTERVKSLLSTPTN